MKFKSFLPLVITFSFMTILSCDRETVLKSEKSPDFTVQKSKMFRMADEDYAVNKDIASSIAIIQINKVIEKNQQKSLKTEKNISIKDKEVRNTKTIIENNEELLHIINFKEGGFMVISADKRTIPILAYSENSSIDNIDLKGLDYWIRAAKEQVKKGKEEKEISDKMLKLWEIYEGKKVQKTTKNGRVNWCDNNTSWETGRYVDAVARWGQDGIAKYFAESDGGCGCEKKDAGCGPIAMAQVMRYYQSPNGTLCWNGDCVQPDYSAMPMFIDGSCGYPFDNNIRQISILSRICGNAASTQYGFLGNCATWTIPGNINNGFSVMGYSNGGNWGTLSNQYSSVKSELMTFHPVVFTGATNIFGSNAHIWVGDGYAYNINEYTSWMWDESSGEWYEGCVSQFTDFIGMNWGWNGSSNGYYFAGFSFNGYDQWLRALTDIRP